jgi:threonine dehydrogenase-like Zn-dependent dehydrogenase
MKALLFERSLPKFAAARIAGAVASGRGAAVGPLRLADIDEPALPGPAWHRVRPRLAGICGSDLATVDGKSSRYFEPIVSFPFVPGHEIVGELDDGARVVIAATLTCASRGIDPMCHMCEAARPHLCERQAFGHVEPGLQTGYCAETGGGWSTALVAHESQLHRIPDAMSDEMAVMIEPTACAIHAALTVADEEIAVIGSGTLGLCTIAALRHLAQPRLIISTAKHPEQRRLAKELGADVVVEPDELDRAVRSSVGSLRFGDQLTCGIDAVIDCVGSAESLAQALRVVSPGGTVVLAGMPGKVSVDLTSLWHREVRLVGCYAYGVETVWADDDTPAERSTFELATELVADAGLDRLVSAHYPLDRFRDAIDHAANAGRRGAVKVVFDLRNEKERNR